MNSYIEYLKAALFHPINLMGFGLFLVIGLVTFNPLVLFFAAGWEAAWAGIAPLMPAFRKFIDKKKVLDAKDKRDKDDKAMLQSLPPAVQNRYLKLQSIARSIGENYGKDTQASKLFLNQISTRVDEIMDRYLGMLKAHDAIQRHIQENRTPDLLDKMQALDTEIAQADSQLAQVKSKQKEILEKRYEKAVKAEKDGQILGAQLDTLEELVKLLNSQAVSMKQPEEVNSQLDSIFAEIEVSEATIAELDGSYESFDKELEKAEQQKRLESN